MATPYGNLFSMATRVAMGKSILAVFPWLIAFLWQRGCHYGKEGLP